MITQIADLDKLQFVGHSGRGLVARGESRFSAIKLFANART